MFRYATLVAAMAVVCATTAPVCANVNMPMQSAAKADRPSDVQTFVNRATDCVVQAIEKDGNNASEEMPIGELIVAAMPACTDRMHAMIDSFDSAYGAGSGERFFSGTFLDLLPLVVNKRIGRDIGAK